MKLFLSECVAQATLELIQNTPTVARKTHNYIESSGVIRSPVKVDISKIEPFYDKELSLDMIEFLSIPNNQL